MSRSPSFLIVIPTFNHPGTVEFSIRSALQQTLKGVYVAVVGDGVSDRTKAIVGSIAKEDKRLRFYDFPKSLSKGEEYRDQIIRELSPDFVTYLGDDDLLLPHHCEVMLDALREAEFVHPQPVYIGRDGQIHSFFRTDLSVDLSLEWHLDFPWQNSISLTGAAHTLEAYLSLDEGWTPTPSNRWSDHFMWQKFFSTEGLRFSTSPLATTVKFRARLFSEAEQVRQIRYFFPRLTHQDFRVAWDCAVAEAISRENVEAFIELRSLRRELADAVKEIETLKGKM